MNLIFIGKNYPNFVEEARKFDVSRNIPWTQLAGLNFGDEIFCATYESAGEYEPMYEKNSDGTRTELLGKQRLKNLGQANLLCSFTLRDIYVRTPGISQELNQALWHDGLVTSVEACSSDCTPISRACGSYTMGIRAIIQAPVSRIYEELKRIAKEHKLVGGRKVHVMIGGKLKKVFEPGIFIRPIKFTRGLLTVPDDIDFGQDYEELHYQGDVTHSEDAYIVEVRKYGKIDVGKARSN
jgi:hypothetical protein